MSLLKDFGEAVRTLREGEGLSQEGLAGRVGLDRTYVSGIERGVRNPTLRVIAKIAAGLGVSLVDLFRAQSSQDESSGRER